MTAPYRAAPLLPEGMGGPTWEKIKLLPTVPTSRHPMGMRHAVLERAAILHFNARLPWPEADERALAEEAGQAVQQDLVMP